MTADVSQSAPPAVDSPSAEDHAPDRGVEVGGTSQSGGTSPLASQDRSSGAETEPADPPHPQPKAGGAALTPPETGAGLERKRQRRQSTALAVLAVIAVLFVMHAARAVLLPVVIALVLTLLLRPLVRRCRSLRIPDAASAAVIMVGLMLLAGAGVAQLIVPAQDWIDNGPHYLREVGEKLHFVRERVEEINRTSKEVQALAAGGKPARTEDGDEEGQGESLLDRTLAGITGGRKGRDLADKIEDEQPIPVEVRQPSLVTGLTFLSTTGEVLAGIVITVVLTYFLLATGDHLLNNVLHVLPTFRDKRKVVEMVHEVEIGVSAYLLTVTLINIGLGVAIGLAMWLLGMPNPALWGAMATVLNFIPYLGAMVGTIIVFLVGVFTFDAVSYALLVPVVYFGLTALEGNLVTPALLGKRMSLSPVVVFLALVFWSWMWGIGGALIAVPTLAILKVGFDQFDRTRPFGTLIGG
jgi:predicted PurR-regulated permease PerM